jgi:formylglycine-generating enzyme required for sulfatase activity
VEGNRKIKGFYIGKYELTIGQWISIHKAYNIKSGKGDGYYMTKLSCVGRTNTDNYPMTNLTWSEAQEFIRELNTITGNKYRLPTSEEWEYAARGGNKKRRYKYSGSDKLDEVAWHDGNTNCIHPVGEKMPNDLGIYDMSGNVAEWCSDYQKSNLDHLYYMTDDTPSKGQWNSDTFWRMFRGGGGEFDGKALRVTNKEYGGSPTFKTGFLGVRLVLVP